MPSVCIIVNDPPRIMQLVKYDEFRSKIQHIYNVGCINLYLELRNLQLSILIESDADLQCAASLSQPLYFRWSTNNNDATTSSIRETEEVEEEIEEEIDVINATVVAVDLSRFQNTTISSGSRWDDMEKAYLKNFHKFLAKLKKKLNREVKADYDRLHEWLTKRKTTQEHLFGQRTTSAIISMYDKMKRNGDFNN